MSNENSGVKIPKKQQSAKKRKTLFIVLAVLLCMFGAVIALSWNKILGPCVEMHANAVKLVSESTEDTFKASQTSLVYDNEGELMFSLRGEKDVYYLEYDEIPDAAKLAMISIEDKKFVNHRGVDPKAIIRAAVALVKNAGEVTQGGSTITQQLSRNVFLTHKVSWQRKVEEIFISIELEKKYSKEDIMEYYLNNVYFSKGYYGIQAASQGYFNKNADELSLSQIAFLCAIPNGPSMYDPIDHPENTIKRRNRILEEMLEDEVISQEQYDAAVAEEITVLQKKKKDVSDYVETFVLKCSVESLMKEGGFEFKNTFDSKEEEAPTPKPDRMPVRKPASIPPTQFIAASSIRSGSAAHQTPGAASPPGLRQRYARPASLPRLRPARRATLSPRTARPGQSRCTPRTHTGAGSPPLLWQTPAAASCRSTG